MFFCSFFGKILEYGKPSQAQPSQDKPCINCVRFISLISFISLCFSLFAAITTNFILSGSNYFFSFLSIRRIAFVDAFLDNKPLLLLLLLEAVRPNRIIAANTIEVCNSFVEAKMFTFFLYFRPWLRNLPRRLPNPARMTLALTSSSVYIPYSIFPNVWRQIL